MQFSWGIPDNDVVTKIRSAGAKLGIQVSSRENAENALSRDPDFLICQGLEAGGHVQATSPLRNSVPGVLEAAGDIPVLLAGGISNGRDIKALSFARFQVCLLFLSDRPADLISSDKIEI